MILVAPSSSLDYCRRHALGDNRLDTRPPVDAEVGPRQTTLDRMRNSKFTWFSTNTNYRERHNNYLISPGHNNEDNGGQAESFAGFV